MSRRLTVARAGVLTVLLASWLAAIAPQARASGPLVPTGDPFYSYSGSLDGIAPGSVLRTRSIAVAEGGNPTPITATQILYRTTGQLGEPTATVATVIRPATEPVNPKIVSYQTAYDALGPQCDPSYTLQGGNPGYSTAQDEEQVILAYAAAGDTVVVPDYEGENLDWAAGQESGYGTLDGIRATEKLLGLAAGSTPVGIVGYSGGSIATEFASELAPAYAKELDIVGAAEGGIPVDMFHNLSYINGSSDWSGVIPAVLVSLSRAFGVSFAQYLSPYGVKVTNQVKNECINDFIGAYPGLTYQKLLGPQHQNIDKIPVFVKITNQLIMGRTGTPKGPLFIGIGDADGTGDGVMVTKDDEALAHTYCQRGVSVQFNVYSGDDHDNAATKFEPGALAFLTQRLNGSAVSNGCSSIGAGNALDPMPVPANSAPKHTPKLKLKLVGRRARLHGVVIQLWTTTGTFKHLVVTLRRGKKLIVSDRVARVTKSKHRLVLRHRGRMPERGRYRLKVTQGHRTLLAKTLKIR